MDKKELEIKQIENLKTRINLLSEANCAFMEHLERQRKLIHLMQDELQCYRNRLIGF